MQYNEPNGWYRQFATECQRKYWIKRKKQKKAEKRGKKPIKK